MIHSGTTVDTFGRRNERWKSRPRLSKMHQQPGRLQKLNCVSTQKAPGKWIIAQNETKFICFTGSLDLFKKRGQCCKVAVTTFDLPSQNAFLIVYSRVLTFDQMNLLYVLYTSRKPNRFFRFISFRSHIFTCVSTSILLRSEILRGNSLTRKYLG